MTFLVDHEALDVARMAGVAWQWQRIHQRGPQHPFIDLDRLDWWDKWRVAWARIGAYHWIHHG